MPTSFSERIAAWLLAGRWPLLLLAILAAAICVLPAQHVKFDRSIENMFAPDDPLLPPYRQLKNVFGGNEVVLAVYSDPQLLDESRGGIERLTEISRQLKDTPGVRDVLSLAEVDMVLDKVASAAGLLQSSDVPENGIVDSQSPLAKRFLKLFEGYTHGSDGRTAAVICMLEPQESPGVTREETVNALREKIQRLAGGTVAGEPVMVVDGFPLCRGRRPATGLGLHHLALGRPADLFSQPALDGAVHRRRPSGAARNAGTSGRVRAAAEHGQFDAHGDCHRGRRRHGDALDRPLPRGASCGHVAARVVPADDRLADTSRVLGDHDRRRRVLLLAGCRRGSGAGLWPDDGRGVGAGAGQRDAGRPWPDPDRSPGAGHRPSPVRSRSRPATDAIGVLDGTSSENHPFRGAGTVRSRLGRRLPSGTGDGLYEELPGRQSHRPSLRNHRDGPGRRRDLGRRSCPRRRRWISATCSASENWNSGLPRN